MPWPGSTLKLALLLLAATVGPPGLWAEQSVGCMYSERLCLEDEWCYDDYAFGRCLQATGDVTEEDLYRFNLGREELHELSAELRRLFALGYRWSHSYTQCRLQAMLYATQHDMTFEQNACTHLVDQDLEAALKVLEGQVPLDPQEIAVIKYTPSVDNPHADFADEVYYPPADDQARQSIRDKILQPNAVDLIEMEDPYNQYNVVKRTWIPQMHRRSLPQYFTEQYNTPGNFRLGKETRDDLDFLPELEPYYQNNRLNEQLYPEPENIPTSNSDMSELYPIIKYLNEMRLSPREIEKLLSPKNYNKLVQLLSQFELSDTQNQQEDYINNLLKKKNVEDSDDDEGYQSDAVQEGLLPDKYNPDWLPKDSIPFVDEFPESRIYFDENESSDAEYPGGEEYSGGHPSIPDEIFRERKTARRGQSGNIFRELKQHDNDHLDGQWGQIQPNPRIYTEGGVVYVPPTQDQADLSDFAGVNINRLLEKYNLGFKRPERLDVKKPGPPFDPQIMDAVNKAIKNEQQMDEDNIFIPNMMKKEPRGVHPNPAHEIHDNDEDQYVYVKFENNLKSWKQGQDIINRISSLLHLEPTAFTDGHVDPHELAFKVLPNSRNLNYTEVAKRIDIIKDRLEELTGIKVVSVGIGDKSRMQTEIASKYNNTYSTFLIVISLVCGVLIALIFATLLLLVIKKQVKKFEKLQGLSKPDSEASKDYQDLCRARMAGKQPPPGDTVHGRITSLSRESEQSPSSRSSTSSWSEEPALHNMDISTGHMVLTYMEDHLKNKDRLEQEWVALCAYVAEPNETTNALKKENADKNRYKEIVPYNHARVVLNELSNANGSDYINASSITDHDPRNPAYIATQGPLPHTAPEFWQLIWEQGAVVIVMLTRLTEGGAAMCHRYWPEEGSELYHIYEVHLVSEHIWCDDYLVRSFYLKNVRTGETRTVTQFHFLSWPEAGVPASTKALLEFRRKVNKSYRGRSCPIVVHCSDGAGRTGTYCLIDMVLSRMAKGAKEIDIAATLEHLRDQRPRMVSTKQQFEFVLTAVAEEVHAILKALPPQPNPPAQAQEKDK